MKTYLFFVFIAILYACSEYDEVPIKEDTHSFYQLFSQTLEHTIDNVYHNVNFEDDAFDLFDKAGRYSLDFVKKQGSEVMGQIDTVNDYSGISLSDVININKEQFSSSQFFILNKVQKILDKNKYTDVRYELAQLYNIIKTDIPVPEQDLLRKYIEGIEYMLNTLERNKQKISFIYTVVNTDLRNVQQVKKKAYQMTKADNIPNGIYPHPNNPKWYIVVADGIGVIMECPDDLIFDPAECECIQKKEESWWESWGKCLASILGGTGTGGLAGAGVGSVVPLIGTAAGAIVGAISGGLTGAAAGC